MRDDKYDYPYGNNDKVDGKWFQIKAIPNPFSESITFNISVEDASLVPEILIYDTKMVLIKTFDFKKAANAEYEFNWDGISSSGTKVPAGAYIIVCSVGDKRTAKKVIYQP